MKTSTSKKQSIDKQIARYIFATNSPFRHVDHPQFIQLIEELRPGYKPPNRKDISGHLLDNVYEEEKQKFREFIQNEIVCLGFDGWSNVHNDPIVCLTVTTKSGEVFLLDTIDTSGHAHTADYLESITYNSIKKCEDELKCRIRSVVTDNAANVKKTRLLLEKRPDLDIITYGCSAHILNLLANDCQSPDITKHVLSVVKYFRNNHFANACYRKSGNLKLVVPIEVRWNTMCDCLESYIKAWPTMLRICEENRQTIDKDIQSKVGNVGIKRNAEDLLLILKPISIALDTVQSNTCTIADSVRVWKMLEKSFRTVGNDECLKKFKSRYEMAMSEAHFLAYMLDPKEKSPELDLTQEEKSKALDFAKAKYPEPESDILPIIIKFQAKSAPFQKQFFQNSVASKVTTIEWWKSQKVDIDKVDSNIINVIEQFYTAQASSAGVERIFSSFGLVQSKLRNRLGTEKASKLFFLFKIFNTVSNNEDE